jgi:hypothetical protein
MNPFPVRLDLVNTVQKQRAAPQHTLLDVRYTSGCVSASQRSISTILRQCDAPTCLLRHSELILPSYSCLTMHEVFWRLC